MKFLCVPCDSPMKLQTVGPPERGSLSIVYSCPECGYEMAMLTNAHETQVVQSLGVRIGPEVEAGAERLGGRVSVSRDDPQRAAENRAGPVSQSSPVDCRCGSAAREHSRVRPPDGADRHREIRPGAGRPGSRREDPRRRRASSSACNRPAERGEDAADERDAPGPIPERESTSRRVRPALRHLLEPHLPLQPACEHCYLDAGGPSRWSARRTSPIGASSAPRNASRSSTRSPRSHLNA